MKFPHLHLHFPLDLDQYRDRRLHIFHKEHFGKIEGYDDIKCLVRRALDSDENYNLLFVGPPASSKTLFLQEVLEYTDEKGIFFDATNTTNRILNVLEEKRPNGYLSRRTGEDVASIPKSAFELLGKWAHQGRPAAQVLRF